MQKDFKLKTVSQHQLFLKGIGYSSVVKHSFSSSEALGSIFSSPSLPIPKGMCIVSSNVEYGIEEFLSKKHFCVDI